MDTAFRSVAAAGGSLPGGTAPLKASVHPLNLVVVADTDLLADYLWVHAQEFFGQRLVQAWASNGDLVLNALDNLAGSDDLISVRGRATFTRPFERVEQLRRAANDRFRDKEHELEQQLQSTEQKLTALQSKGGGRPGAESSLIVTPQEQEEIEHFGQEKIRIRKELRAVRAGLDADISRLGTEIKIVDIIVIPAAFALLALGFALWRRRARTRAAAEPRP